MTARVALVVVSHSRRLAEGVVELAAQMAPAVVLVPAGGQDDGSLGTSFDAILAAIDRATADGASAVVLADVGSAVLTTESVLELCDPDVVERVALADAPLVEGAVAAAVEAQSGADLASVRAAAEHAASIFRAGPGPAPTPISDDADVVGARVEVRNPMGLHARPAAVLARAMVGFDARVSIDGIDAASVLELMALGATKGRELAIEGRGPQGRAAVDAAVAMITEGFGEL